MCINRVKLFAAIHVNGKVTPELECYDQIYQTFQLRFISHKNNSHHFTMQHDPRDYSY